MWCTHSPFKRLHEYRNVLSSSSNKERERETERDTAWNMLSEFKIYFQRVSRDVLIKTAGVKERNKLPYSQAKHWHAMRTQSASHYRLSQLTKYNHSKKSFLSLSCSNTSFYCFFSLSLYFFSIYILSDASSSQETVFSCVSRQIVDMVLVNWYGAQWCDNNFSSFYCVQKRCAKQVHLWTLFWRESE